MGLSKNTSNPAIYYSISFSYDGISYTGRLSPDKNEKDGQSRWHVVLNEVFFGYLYKDGSLWKVSEQRPAGLIKKVGRLIDTKSYRPHRI